MLQTEVLIAQRLRGGTIIKTILIGNTIGCSLLVSIAGVFALFGAESIQWNEQYVTGIKGFIASPFIGAFIGFLFGLFTAFFTYIGLRVLSLFRPLTVEYVPCNTSVQPTAAAPAD